MFPISKTVKDISRVNVVKTHGDRNIEIRKKTMETKDEGKKRPAEANEKVKEKKKREY